MKKTQAPLRVASHDYVYRSLRAQIMQGAIAPGTAVTLRGVSHEYSVSMTPVREALRRLVAEGALVLSHSGRIATPELSQERIEELAALRSLIETELASRALRRAHMALIDRMVTINRQLIKAIQAKDTQTYIQTNLDFHRLLYLRAHAPAMLAMAETVWLQLGPTMRRAYAGLEGKEPPHGHSLILSALRGGDEPGLRLAVRMDVTEGLKILLS